MNEAGYKIIHIGDGRENGYHPIVIVKANPIIENAFSKSFIPYECSDTDFFFFPDDERVVDKVIKIAQGEGIWYPDEDDFEEQVEKYWNKNEL